MNQITQHTGQCFCGKVQFTLSGEPEAMAYCHCDSCRQWSAGPVNAFTLWKPENFKISRGKENISEFSENPDSNDKNVNSNRKWCKNCGGHVFIDHPGMGVIDVPTAVISDFIFQPGFHVHYQETKHCMHDGLPKFKDLPYEAGGSGEILEE